MSERYDLYARRRVPSWIKWAYTAFMLVLVPSYWLFYGPSNFLYFCDVALFFTLVAVWTEAPLLAGAPAVGILMPQMLWCVDYVSGLLTGHTPLRMTSYMFDYEQVWSLAFYCRMLSLFHAWLPILLLYLVARLGYDRRSFWTWVAISWVLLPICYLWMPGPQVMPKNDLGTSAPCNINYVFGLDDTQPQQHMAPYLWFWLLMAGMPLCIYLPTHWLLEKFWGGRRRY